MNIKSPPMVTRVTRRPILVGECNPYSRDPKDALSPHFPGSSGRRLWAMVNDVMPMEPEAFLALFDRRNLCGLCWSDRVAERGARALREELKRGDVVVLLGHRVRRAMGVPPVSERGTLILHDVTYHCVPHPSGVNRVYNDPIRRRRVAELLLGLKVRRVAA